MNITIITVVILFHQINVTFDLELNERKLKLQHLHSGLTP